MMEDEKEGMGKYAEVAADLEELFKDLLASCGLQAKLLDIRRL